MCYAVTIERHDQNYPVTAEICTPMSIDLSGDSTVSKKQAAPCRITPLLANRALSHFSILLVQEMLWLVSVRLC